MLAQRHLRFQQVFTSEKYYTNNKSAAQNDAALFLLLIEKIPALKGDIAYYAMSSYPRGGVYINY